MTDTTMPVRKIKSEDCTHDAIVHHETFKIDGLEKLIGDCIRCHKALHITPVWYEQTHYQALYQHKCYETTILAVGAVYARLDAPRSGL